LSQQKLIKIFCTLQMKNITLNEVKKLKSINKINATHIQFLSVVMNILMDTVNHAMRIIITSFLFIIFFLCESTWSKVILLTLMKCLVISVENIYVYYYYLICLILHFVHTYNLPNYWKSKDKWVSDFKMYLLIY